MRQLKPARLAKIGIEERLLGELASGAKLASVLRTQVKSRPKLLLGWESIFHAFDRVPAEPATDDRAKIQILERISALSFVPDTLLIDHLQGLP